ncbi:hypothetical protein MHH57_21465 [Paenibacillus sp. FSL H7-0442]
MEKLEILAAVDFDMEVQGICDDGSCLYDCETPDGHCDAVVVRFW